MDKVKVGFIGAGGIAAVHLERLLKVPQARIVAICDVAEARAKERAGVYKAAAYTDHHEMLERERLDAVWVCLPPFAHTDEISLAAERSVHVFVEKPLALTLELARSMQASVESAGVKSWVGYHMRQYASVRRAKALLQAEGGPIALFEGNWWGGIAGGPEHWWRRKELSGGQVVEQATHIYDLARFLAGEVREVYGRLDTLVHKDEPNYTVEDVATALLRFRSGALGIITNTSAAQPGGGYVGAKLVAKNVQLTVEGPKVHVLRGQESIELQATSDPYLDEDRKFIQSILNDEPTEVPIREGVKTLAVTLSVVKSAETGKTVKVPV
ncbi:MAG: Gfo/Idh/MocA family oxidoreductase [Candidatus Bathyarchaeia archaeon]